jgi:hypothetical protein
MVRGESVMVGQDDPMNLVMKSNREEIVVVYIAYCLLLGCNWLIVDRAAKNLFCIDDWKTRYCW